MAKFLRNIYDVEYHLSGAESGINCQQNTTRVHTNYTNSLLKTTFAELSKYLG